MTTLRTYLRRQKRWTDALRSGTYRQGQKSLRYRDPSGNVRHCCLGVVCEVQGVPARAWRGSVSLPREAQEWLGVSAKNPFIDLPLLEFRNGDRDLTLTEMNDDLGLTFEQIADVVDYFDLDRSIFP